MIGRVLRWGRWLGAVGAPALAALLVAGCGSSHTAASSTPVKTVATGSATPHATATGYAVTKPQVQSPAMTVAQKEQRAFVALAWRANGTAGSLPGGCAVLAGQRFCVPSVSVDGRHVSDTVVLSHLVGRSGDAASVHQAVAMTAMDVILQRYATQAKVRVPLSEARGIARNELKAYQSAPATAARSLVLPPGVTAKQYFLAPSTVKGYQTSLLVAEGRERLLTQHRGESSAIVFSQWLTTALHRNTVLVNGSPPAYSLPAALRAGLDCAAAGYPPSCR